MGWSMAARKIEEGLERTFASKQVTYDLGRLMTGAKVVSCSRFGEIVCINMEG
jgi:isocitrate dehydrogenase